MNQNLTNSMGVQDKDRTIFIVLKRYNKTEGGAKRAHYYISQYFAKYTNRKVVIYCQRIDDDEELLLNMCPNTSFVVQNRGFAICMPYHLAKSGADVFFSLKSEYALLVGLITKIKDIKNIRYIHGFIFEDVQGWFRKSIFYRRFLGFTIKHVLDLIFIPSHDLLEYIHRFFPSDKYVLQYNAMELQKKYKSKEKIDTRKILYVGGYKDYKGIDRLIKIAKENPTYQFYIYGDTNTVNKTEIEAQFIHLKNIEIHGYSKDLGAVMDTFDVLLYPTLRDNLPYAIIEAMGRGIVCLSTDVAELKHIIKDGKNGILLKNQNNLDFYLDENLESISQNAIRTYDKLFDIKNYSDLLVKITSFL